MATNQGEKKHLRKRISLVLKRVEFQLMNGQVLPYFEPFCGICGILRHFLESNNRLIYASDINPDLIFMWKIIQYTKISSYSGSEQSNNKTLDDTSFLATLTRKLAKISNNIERIIFCDPCSYEEYDPKGMLIYCDPPTLTNETFWDTMRRWNKCNLVFIAAKSSPRDFIKIWEDKQSNSDHLYIHQELASLLSKKLKEEIKAY